MRRIYLADMDLNDANNNRVENGEDNSISQMSLETWKHFFNTFTKAVIVADLEMNILFENAQALKLYHQLGWNQPPVNIQDFFSLVSHEKIKEHKRNLLDNGSSIDIWPVKGSGSFLYELELNAVLDFHTQRVIYMLLPYLKVDEPLLEGRDNLYLDILNDLKCYVIIHTKKGIIVDVNNAFCELTKMDKSKLLGKDLGQFIATGDKEKFETVIHHASSKSSNFHFFELLLDSKEHTYQYTTQFNFYSGLYYTIIYDILEEPEQNRCLIEGIQSVFCQSRDGIVMVDSKGNIIQTNEHICALFEKKQIDLINLNIEELIGVSMKSLFGFGDHEKAELTCNLPSGQKKVIEVTKKQISKSPYTLMICEDISEKWEMKRELRISENKFKKIFDGTFDGIIIWADDGIIYDINEPGAAIIGSPIEEIQNKKFQEIFDLNDQQTKHLQRHISLIQKNKHHHFVCEITCRDGQNKQLDFSSRLDAIPGKNLTIFRDVTDKLRMEEQLKKSDTLNVVGELAAGIAHEIRNPMTALKGFIQLLEGSLNGEFSTYFQVITSELQRIETIITDFLILAKPQAVSYQIKQVNTIIADTLDLLSAQASMLNIQFHTHFANIPLVHCESNQLKQVFINLIKNAIEAMPAGGFIDIATELFFDNHVLISIQDYGTGIPEAVLEKLGEPFYTTKEKGTGLGLMVTYKIIEEHAGWIEVTSEEGKGTLFQIYLPINHEFS